MAYRVPFAALCVVASGCGSSTTSTTPSTPSTPATLSAPAIVLGRPADTSMFATVKVDPDTEIYLEYGTASGAYGSQTGSVIGTSSGPSAIAVSGLHPDTAYFYRARYRARGESTYRMDAEHSFHTQRPAGTAFTFAIEADPHLDYNSSTAVYSQTLLNVLADRPDFLIDLGDASMVDKCAIDGTTLCAAPSPVTQATVLARNTLMRGYFESVGHSVPMLMVIGNHDGEAGWAASSDNNTIDAWSLNARKSLFPNPEPGTFYTGSSEPWPGLGLRQNYYAFEWGNALIVVLDPYTYTSKKPGADGWGWTLGTTQYQWLARTLQASRARFKFVFSHHLVGGNGTDARGGAAFAQFFEWGGRNLDGTWGFDKQRPGWAAPIHQLLVENKVTIWFHGHDHLYAQEQVDGVVYQEVPQPSLATYDNPNPGGDYGYVGAVGANIFPSSGHLRLTVGASDVRVEYVRSVAPADETANRKNRSIVTSYVVR